MSFSRGRAGRSARSKADVGPPRVVVFGPHAEGGHRLYVTTVARATVEAGFEHLTIATSRGADTIVPGVEIWADLPPIRSRQEFRSTPGWMVNRLLHYWHRDRSFLAEVERRSDVKLVHWQEYTPWLLRRWIRRLHRVGIGSVVTVHNLEPHDKYPLLPVRLTAAWHRDALSEADALFVHSERMATQLADRLNRGRSRVYVVHHGVWGQPVVPESEAFRGHLLVFGALRRNKGIEVACEVVASESAWQLRICGPADDLDYHEELLATVRASTARERISLEAGFVPDQQLSELMRWADVVLLPYTEQFQAQSGVAHLAIGHGVPVVAFPVGAITELLTDHEVGVLASEHSAAGMANAIRGLALPGRLSHLRRCVGSARDSLSWERAGEITAGVYKELQPAPTLGQLGTTS